MKTKIIIAALALMLAIPAAAQMRLITQSFECTLNNVRLPQSNVGTIAYKPCADCDYRTNRVSPNVVWELNGQSMRLPEFRKRLSIVDDRREQTITVKHHLDQNRVVKVSVYLRDAE